jgi:hypothetical protein
MKPVDGPAPGDERRPESILPGDRSGLGSKDLFKHVERDIRRRAGLLPDQKTPQNEPKKLPE